VVTGVSKHSVVRRRRGGEVPEGHQGAWYESKGPWLWPLVLGSTTLARICARHTHP